MIEWSIEDHVRCGKDIQRIWSLHSWYIREFHQKKCKYKLRYKVNNKRDGRFYSRHLFYKKRGMSSMSTFPSCFKSAMEGLMYDRFQDDPLCTINIYYGAVGRIEHVGELFSTQPTLSQRDKRIVLSFNREYVSLMQKCIKEIEFRVPKHCDLNKMKKWCRHVESLDRWNLLRKHVRSTYCHKHVAFYWFEISQRKHLSQMIAEDYHHLME